MTTQQKPKAAQHNDLKFGPVATPLVAAFWALFMASVGKATGAIAPWWALLAGAVMAVIMVWTGLNRRPRPLSRVSLIYRAGAVTAAGMWVWCQLATFTPIGLPSGRITTLVLLWPGTAALILLAALARRVNMLFRLALPALALLACAGVTLTSIGPVLNWLHSALAVVDPIPAGFLPAVTWVGQALLSLLFVTGPMAVAGATFANRDRTADEQAAAEAAKNLARTPGGEARKFQRLICKLTNEVTEHRATDPYEPGHRTYNLGITDVRFWANGAGETYIIDLTGGKRGTTIDNLRSVKKEVATKLNLPDGCGMEVLTAVGTDGKRMGRGYAAIDISRVNVLENRVDYPDIRQRSILNQMPLGHTRSGVELGPYFRESSAYVWGQKGSGKTGTIYDIVAGALQCTDCLVWVIDLNKGNAARPFLKAFAEGRVDRPCIDWVATTIEEVAEMARVGLDIALDRKNFYADLKYELDLNLMPVGNGAAGQPPPEILIVIDEGATVLGIGGGQISDHAREARQVLSQIMDLARDAAVNIVFSGLRATADVADPGFKAGTAIRIGMRVTDDAELAYGFGDYTLSGSEVPYQGSGYILCGHEDAAPQVFKAYYLAPKRMAAIGEQVTPWRPYLDARSAQVGGMGYATRWQRTARALWDRPAEHVLNYGVGPDDSRRVGASAVPAATTTGTAPAVRPTHPADPSMIVPTEGGFDELMRHARRMRGPDAGNPGAAGPVDGGGVGPAEPAAQHEPGIDYVGRFEEIVGQLEQEGFARDPDKTPAQELEEAPTTRQLLERIVRKYGPISAGDMYEKLTTGGEHGAAVRISYMAMTKALREPGRNAGPAGWLAPRGKGEPYQHRDNVSG